MFWIGLLIGIILGAAGALIFIAPIVDQIDELEKSVWDNRRKLEKSELELRHCKTDLQVLVAMAPKEIVHRFYDGAYRN